jgi:Fe-S oxidoreductase
MTKLTECLECLLCVSACPLSKAASREFAGPAALVQVAKFMIDPRDGIKDERLRKIRDELWLCANCNSCNNCCPTSLPVLQGINDLCSRTVETGFIPRTLQAALTSIYKNANPWRGAKDRRDQWADGLKIKRLPKNKTKLLYFVGCTPSYDTRAQQVARSMVTILDEAGVDFGILGNEENCCGSPVARIGDLGLQELLVEQNIKMFDKYEIEKIVTTCPHCYDTLANDYKKYGGRFEVQHYTQFIADLIDQNRLVIHRKIEKKVTYHDPCFLAKHNNITESPRKILENIQGLTLVEMPRNRKNSFCCGGGGGRMWVTDTTEENLNITRSKEAASISPNIVVATCQFCLINLTDGIKAIDKDKEIQVLDLAELLKDVCIRGNR